MNATRGDWIRGAMLLLAILGLLLIFRNAGLVLLLVIGAYFLPSIVATSRGHHNPNPIFVLNFFLGWTLIGWVVALAMAVSRIQEPVEVIEVARAPATRRRRRPLR